jgi:succinate-semialdehyde dehydrogenase/glutarate-semialdehyde dehydrogenase
MTNDFPVTLSDPSLLGSNGLVAGQWRLSSSRKTFPVYEPSTGNVLHHCADMGKIDFVKAIESAHTGFLKFSTSTTAKYRGTLLRRWYELILKHQDDCMFMPTYSLRIYGYSYLHPFFETDPII